MIKLGVIISLFARILHGCSFVVFDVISDNNGITTEFFQFNYPLNDCGGYQFNSPRAASMQFQCLSNGTANIPYLLTYDNGVCNGPYQSTALSYGSQIPLGIDSLYLEVISWNCDGGNNDCDIVDIGLYAGYSCTTNTPSFLKASTIIGKCLAAEDDMEPYSAKLQCKGSQLQGSVWENAQCSGSSYKSNQVKNEQCYDLYNALYSQLYVEIDCNGGLSLWSIIVIIGGSIIYCICCCGGIYYCTRKRRSTEGRLLQQ